MSDAPSVLDDPAAALDVPALYRALLLPRVIEEKMLRLIRQGRLSKWFSGYGQEAIAVGCAWALGDEDVLLPMHRNLGVWTTRGVPLRPLFCQLMGKAGGFTAGRDRTFHFGLPAYGIVGMISHMAAMLPVACGLGQAFRYRGQERVALAFCGDGGSREGDFHEALNLAAVWDLPVVFVVENNGYGLSTPTEDAVPVADLADAAGAYGMPGKVVDGNDLLAVIDAVESAAIWAQQEGPVLLEMKTFRMRGHEEASGTAYVPGELVDAWADRDPVNVFTRNVLAHGLMRQADVQALRDELEAEVDDVAEWALAQPAPSSTPAAERAALFAPAPPPATLPDADATADAQAEAEAQAEADADSADADEAPPETEKRYLDAIGDGLRQAMAADDRVILMGQDIAGYGGVFKLTAGFVGAFGPERVRDTPIIESGAIGAALGLAIEGLTPVVELQYADFIACGFNQTVNNLATTHYRWGQPVNVTLRMPYGGGLGAGPFHSQAKEAWFCHVPGLKVVVPATPRDAKGLLLASLQDPNPVLFFEHKALYRSLKGLVPDAPYDVPLGAARVALEGTDATVVTYGIGVHWALEEAARLAAATGAEVEVIDLRTLVPWDRETVRRSVEKTNRLLVLHEATRTAGFGAELAAELTETCFAHLDAPPLRVAAEDLPVPFAKPLETDVFSARPRLGPALDRLLAF